MSSSGRRGTRSCSTPTSPTSCPPCAGSGLLRLPQGGQPPFNPPPRSKLRALPPELCDLVVVTRRVPDEALGQGEDPLRHAQGQRQAAAPGAEVRLGQPHRVVRLEPHVDQLRSRQPPPAVAVTSPPDRPLLAVG